MLDQPDGRELLSVARQTLLQRIVPALPDDLRYDALMVGNAIAIAAREIGLTSQTVLREQQALARLVGEAAQGLDLPALRRLLCDQIRSGVFDGARLRELGAVLRDSVDGRLAISNPKLLSTQR